MRVNCISVIIGSRQDTDDQFMLLSADLTEYSSYYQDDYDSVT